MRVVLVCREQQNGGSADCSHPVRGGSSQIHSMRISKKTKERPPSLQFAERGTPYWVRMLQKNLRDMWTRRSHSGCFRGPLRVRTRCGPTRLAGSSHCEYSLQLGCKTRYLYVSSDISLFSPSFAIQSASTTTDRLLPAVQLEPDR